MALFDDLEKNELEELLFTAGEKLYRTGEKIIKQGDVGSYMGVLKEGLLNVLIKAREKEDLKAGIITPG